MQNNYTFELIGQHPDNIQLLTNALFDIKDTMFRRVYDIQKSLIGLERFDFVFDEDDPNNAYDDGSDEIRDRPWQITSNECVFTINKSLIKSSMRSEYKRSYLYGRDLNTSIINEKQNIFSRNVIVYINGGLIPGIRVKPMESFTQIIFPFKNYNNASSSEIYMTRDECKQELLREGAKLTVLFIQNDAELYQDVEITTSKAFSNLLNITVNVETRTDKHFLPILHLENKAIPDSKSYKLLPAQSIYSKKNDGRTIYITPDPFITHYNASTIPGLSKIVIKPEWNNYSSMKYTELVFPTNSLREVVHINNKKYFTFKSSSKPIDYDLPMPIPVENILLYKITADGMMEFVHNPSAIRMYYPDIYEITEQTGNDKYIAIAMYYDDTDGIGSQYKNELSLYRKYIGIKPADYDDNTIHEYIKNYKPVSMEYDIPSYIESVEHPDALKYKMSKLKEMIYKDGNNYKFYLNKLMDYAPEYEIHTKQIDLDSRKRNNNFSEVSDTEFRTEFDSKCYLFVIRADDTEQITLWIDGELYIPKYSYTVGDYTYVYIPTNKIIRDDEKSIYSVITVEKYKDFDYVKSVNITSTFNILTDYIEVSFPNKKIIPNEIYLGYIDTGGIERYVNAEKYSFFYKVDGTYYPVDNAVFYQYDTLYIKLNDLSFLNKTITINITNSSFIVNNGSLNNIVLNRKIKDDKTNLLMFKNGRLLPQLAVRSNFADTTSGPHEFKALITENHDTDEYTLVYTPTKYYQVYYQTAITRDGFVDLSGKISKPLDPKWYDIYLNGRLLQEPDDIEVVGPYMLKVLRSKSTKNFVVYQKNLDPYELFNDKNLINDYTTQLVYNTLLDTVLRDGNIQDTEDDILDGLIIEFIEFFEEYIGTIGLLNPDIQQITDEMLIKYPMVFDMDQNLFINPYNNKGLEHNAFFNPDNTENPMTVYRE